MDKDILKGLKISLGFILGLSFFFGIAFAVGFHSANQIIGGVFQGNFTVNGTFNAPNIDNMIISTLYVSSLQGGNSIIYLKNGFFDNFNDESGINTSSLNLTFNSTGKFYDSSPIYSSDLTKESGITSTASSEYFNAATYNYYATNLYDGDPNSRWVDNVGGSAAGHWSYIDFGLGNEKDIIRTDIVTDAGGNGPTQVNIQYSSDASSWSNALSNQATVNGVGYYQNFTWASVGSYRYWRVYVVSRGGSGYMHFCDLKYYELGSAQNMLLLSKTIEANNNFDDLTLNILIEERDSVTLNTDILGYVSNDAGYT